MDILISRLVEKKYIRTVEDDIEKYGTGYPDYKKSIEVTDRIVRMIKERAGDVPVAAFMADDKPVYTKAFKEIFKKNNIVFIDGVPSLIKDAEARGVRATINDRCHWNDYGKRIVGDFLAQEIAKRKYLKI